MIDNDMSPNITLNHLLAIFFPNIAKVGMGFFGGVDLCSASKVLRMEDNDFV